jgi:hypothetical protein
VDEEEEVDFVGHLDARRGWGWGWWCVRGDVAGKRERMKWRKIRRKEGMKEVW